MQNSNVLKWVSSKQVWQCEEYVDTLVSDKCEPGMRSKHVIDVNASIVW